MKRIAVLCLLLVQTLVSGCPLLTHVAADHGNCTIAPGLRGRWHEVNELGKPEREWMVERDLQKGNLTIYSVDSERKVNYADSRKGIMSKMGDHLFLFVRNEGDDGTDEGYYIFEFRPVNRDEFVLAGIRQNALPYAATPFEINKFLRENGQKQEIYDPNETTTFRRAAEPAPHPFD